MNAFVNIFFIFLFMFVILCFKMPNIDDGNYLLHKFIIFVALFGFQFIILVMSKIKNKCKIVLTDVALTSIETAVIGVIGYSIYNDLQFMQISETLNLGDGFYMRDKKMQYLYITLIITVLLTFVNTIQLLLGYIPYACAKYD
jgi:hypothetical protein